MEGLNLKMRKTDFDFVEIAHAQLTESELSSVFAYPRFLRILVWLAKPLPYRASHLFLSASLKYT